jgi:hypothetical protein
VTLVKMGTHLATERAGMVTLHLTVDAPELDPNQGHTKQLERPSSSRRESGGAGSHITEDTGKLVDDERESEGSIGARKRSNVRGAKGPCCLQWLQQNGRQG